VTTPQYLPWGAATGEPVSRRAFQQYVGDRISEHDPGGDLADRVRFMEKEPVGELAGYVALRDAGCLLTKGLVVGPPGMLRILPSDITAWALGGMRPPPASPTPSGEVYWREATAGQGNPRDARELARGVPMSKDRNARSVKLCRCRRGSAYPDDETLPATALICLRATVVRVNVAS